MWNDELARRAAAMRARYTAAAPAPSVAPKKTTAKEIPNRQDAGLRVPELPTVPPYHSLGGVWKQQHTKLLLSALGEVDPRVERAARSLGRQQVAYNGLLYLNGKSALDIGVSIGTLPEALRLYDLLLQTVAKRGEETVSKDGTAITVRGETVGIRLRETSLRRPRQAGSTGLERTEYQPTGLLLFSVEHQHGGDLRTPARDAGDIELFLQKIERLAERLPGLRAALKERERQHEEHMAQMQAKWKREEDARRQWDEQQRRFNDVTTDLDEWNKAERIRAYADAFETHCIAARGAIESGGAIDGWLRWLHWYAEHLDPITRPQGPRQQPAEDGSKSE
jgi:hypothetical protein